MSYYDCAEANGGPDPERNWIVRQLLELWQAVQATVTPATLSAMEQRLVQRMDALEAELEALKRDHILIPRQPPVLGSFSMPEDHAPPWNRFGPCPHCGAPESLRLPNMGEFVTGKICTQCGQVSDEKNRRELRSNTWRVPFVRDGGIEDTIEVQAASAADAIRVVREGGHVDAGLPVRQPIRVDRKKAPSSEEDGADSVLSNDARWMASSP